VISHLAKFEYAQAPIASGGFSRVWNGGQGRNRTADASLFRAALYQLSYLARIGGYTRKLRWDAKNSRVLKLFDYSNEGEFPQTYAADRL
jgi:hypothetical protein